jgi:hypothetical protein
MDYRAIIFSGHAVRQMFARAVGADDVAAIVRNGEIIKEYPDDRPYPSFLMLGFVRGAPVHVVVALDEAAGTAIVITAYIPDEQLWSDDFRKRRGE